MRGTVRARSVALTKPQHVIAKLISFLTLLLVMPTLSRIFDRKYLAGLSSAANLANEMNLRSQTVAGPLSSKTQERADQDTLAHPWSYEQVLPGGLSVLLLELQSSFNLSIPTSLSSTRFSTIRR